MSTNHSLELSAEAVTTATVVADYLLCTARERGEVFTNLKLQKVLYYAQAWYLAERGKPLFDEDFQAWVHGPVLPSQYERFAAAVWEPIMEEVKQPDLAADLVDFLDEILNVFGAETAIMLELMTHQEQPWREARRGLDPCAPSTALISRQLMRDFYRALEAERQ